MAASFGADTYLSSDILPELEPKRGKGENLWKAIYQLKGDIIVYIDADIKNIHPRFVYGLVAPLIYRPEVKYVKGLLRPPPWLQSGDSPLRRRTGYRNIGTPSVQPLFAGNSAPLFSP